MDKYVRKWYFAKFVLIPKILKKLTLKLKGSFDPKVMVRLTCSYL